VLKLAWYKALAEMQVEAARRFMGVLWWVVEPIVYMLAFYLVFSVGLRMGGEDYVPFLLCGLVPWKWFASTVQSGSNVISENKGLMNQVYFHKSMLVMMLLITNLLKALIVFGLFLLALLLLGYLPAAAWVAFPLILICQLAIMAGLVSITASLVPFLPDLRLIIDNGILVLFFASGIFFDIADRPEHVQDILYLNPMAVIISAYRSVLLQGVWPDWGALLWVGVLGFLLILLGMRLIQRFDRTYPKVIL